LSDGTAHVWQSRYQAAVPGGRYDSQGTRCQVPRKTVLEPAIPGSRYDRSWNYIIQVRIHHSLERVNISLSGYHSETVKITKWQLWWYSLNDAIIKWRDDYWEWQWRHNTMTKSRWRGIKMQLKSLLQWNLWARKVTKHGRLASNTVLYCVLAMYCTVLYCTVLYCTVLYCIVLYCIVHDTQESLPSIHQLSIQLSSHILVPNRAPSILECSVRKSRFCVQARANAVTGAGGQI